MHRYARNLRSGTGPGTPSIIGGLPSKRNRNTVYLPPSRRNNMYRTARWRKSSNSGFDSGAAPRGRQAHFWYRCCLACRKSVKQLLRFPPSGADHLNARCGLPARNSYWVDADTPRIPGRLDFPDWWQITFELAKRYNKRVGFRIMLENPDVPEPGMPEFLIEKVPYIKLKGEWKGNPSQTRYKKDHQMPGYEHPAYQAAFRELNALLAAELNGNPQIEYMDTMMYGFWGEGHTWPFEGNTFPSSVVARQTWMKMLETQLEFWTKTPLVTNTQPDFSLVGNSDLLDRTIRTHNWIRTDTIFIENTQIEALSNRPAWVAAICEVGMTTGEPQRLQIDEGITYNEKVTSHVLDVGANYWSVWNWHNEAAKNVLSYYEKYPEPIDYIARHIGYRVFASFIWSFVREGTPGLVVGLANKGVASVRLIKGTTARLLRVTVCALHPDSVDALSWTFNEVQG